MIEYIHLRRDINGRNSEIYHCGDDSGEVPPVLIPNTEVKLTSADNTLLETAREDRLLLHPLKIWLCKKPKILPLSSVGRAFGC